jgi:hypothetical protein
MRFGSGAINALLSADQIDKKLPNSPKWSVPATCSTCWPKVSRSPILRTRYRGRRRWDPIKGKCGPIHIAMASRGLRTWAGPPSGVWQARRAMRHREAEPLQTVPDRTALGDYRNPRNPETQGAVRVGQLHGVGTSPSCGFVNPTPLRWSHHVSTLLSEIVPATPRCQCGPCIDDAPFT